MPPGPSTGASTPGLEEKRALLADVFGSDNFENLDYLRWLYEECPSGAAIEANETADGRLLGHYALVPQPYLNQGMPLLIGLSLNAAVSQDARGRGLFSGLARLAYEVAAEAGIKGVLGAANENSVSAFLGPLGHRRLGKLEMRAVRAGGFERGVRHFKLAGGEMEADECLEELAAGYELAGDSEHAVPEWSLERLRWRLRRPGVVYHVHLGRQAAAITTRRRGSRGVPAIVIGKLFPRTGVRRANATGVVRAALVRHRWPLGLHAGVNERVTLETMRLPRRTAPPAATLHFMTLDADAVDQDHFELATFELLDNDTF